VLLSSPSGFLLYGNMRVLIQHCDSLKFYVDADSWTDSPRNAMDFRGSVKALDYIQRHQIGRAQIVLKFEKDEFDVVLPSADCKASQN
jgi:hypothetical protein